MSIDGSVSRGGADTAAAGRAAIGRRTTAMWLVVAAGVIEVGINLKVLSEAFIPPLVVFSVLLAITTALTVFRHRAWTDLVAGIALGLTTASNAPFIAGGLIKPVATNHEAYGIVALGVGIVGAVAGIAAFVEGRRQAPQVPAFRAPLGELLAILVTGVLIGAFYIATMAYAEVQSSPGAGVANGLRAAPTQAPIELTAEAGTFTQHDLSLKAGGGTVYVVNKDNAEHTFDIDLKGKHYSYPVPANSTVAVVLNFDAGTHTYFCAIAGHRSNGMEGKVTAS
jgi:plastocyanin